MRAQTSGAVKPPSEWPTTPRRSPTAPTTASVCSSQPADSSSLGRSTATASCPRSRNAGATRCQSHALPPPPWMSANVATAATLPEVPRVTLPARVWSVHGARGRLARLGRDEPLDEVERGFRDLLPAVVDGQRVATVGHLLDLGDARVALLPFVGGAGDRPRNRVVLLSVEDQQRAPIGVLRVDLRLGPGVEVGVGHLGQGNTRPGHVVSVVKALRLVVIEGVCPAVFELVEGERDGATSIPRVQQERSRCLERGEG